MQPTYIRANPRRRRRRARKRFSRAVAVVVVLGALGGLLAWLVHRRGTKEDLPGYISDAAVLEREYAGAHGKLLDDANARQLFQQAAELSRKGEFSQAAGLLEAASKTAAVPVVYNDLGVLYAKLEDRARTVNAFREALARDPSYPPVHRNLLRLRSITEDEARPLTREIEPNSSNATANVIAVGSPVEGEITAGVNDIDVFKFPAPPAPRDVLTVDIAPGSPDLVPGWSLYDDNMNQIGRASEQPKAGEIVHFSFAPQPNTSFFLSIWGLEQTAGSYTITIKALKAFDAYEPNDDIFHAHPVTLGQTIQADIMDGQDQDFYSFQPDRSGTVDLVLENLTPTFVPGLTAFGPDQRTIGFAPDAKGPGASLQYSMPVEGGQRYYVQVWPVLDRSSGEYKLKLDLR